jgi:hypothetical protein
MPSACRCPSAKREGETSAAFIEADVSSTSATRLAPCPVTVMAGRARATVSASSARSWSSSSGSRCSRWKKVEASRSRSDGSQRSRLETVLCLRRTLRKYSKRSGRARAPSSSARGDRKLMPPEAL